MEKSSWSIKSSISKVKSSKTEIDKPKSNEPNRKIEPPKYATMAYKGGIQDNKRTKPNPLTKVPKYRTLNERPAPKTSKNSNSEKRIKK